MEGCRVFEAMNPKDSPRYIGREKVEGFTEGDKARHMMFPA